VKRALLRIYKLRQSSSKCIRRKISKSILFTTGRGEGNSTTSATPTIASSSSNNIDNNVVNKPKRNKTAKAETGLRKGLVSTTSNASMPNTPSSTKRGLPFFSNAKKVTNTNSTTTLGKGKKVEHTEKDEEDEKEILNEHGQQSSLFPSSFGLRLMSGGSGATTGHSNSKSMSSLSTKLNERVQVST
jgi:hypothetical protein